LIGCPVQILPARTESRGRKMASVIDYPVEFPGVLVIAGKL
jgi:hypothetical protein